ncbi:MAG: resuscitation-promoting factor RpfE [Thermoleophilaceae bacterium]|nr:resuscitation-promoting factor RpfE [Thermoleophilaceae bacterium]
MRKVLVPALCATAAAAPAVALAATDENQTPNDVASATTTPTHELRTDAKHKLDSAVKRARVERRKALRAKARKRAAARVSTASPQLQAIAACESGGNPAAIGGGGAYRGKYQFDYGTWASVGGSGDPAAAPEGEQDMRAQMLLDRSGTSPWPVCGQ